ncbi:Sugar transferase involved in LPS biosynthesis (colanic, teichoic acid) [Hathewaya proteolytica DSM 3090]|uniref:Sugar transferase involved in LPS biosynthesis (Colanic, teichoic acid) n=1 Tax=Hathewaya proteolytica DSM 3090 TaxID=1121331 RepID=A0A1M6PTH2_9CLOT|nr:Sugar transferase involved in LPS biosynthesis (colanic, teichoic acid) [Hathewaya proteolytica DSM 3090]
MVGIDTDKNEITRDEYIQCEKSFMYYFVKRLVDIVGSIVGILLLSPVFFILAIIVKLDSKGPVFFAHKRLGYRGKIIKVYKFRTMVQDAEDLIEKLPEDQKEEFKKNFKLEDDPRITKIGGFLRKTSLDELPQLLNILKGDLTIVGPRPIVEKEIELYGKYGHKLLSVKPGLTGYWQVNGRSDTTYEQRVQLDMEYIDRRNLLLDFTIILKTFVEVFRGRGAK